MSDTPQDFSSHRRSRPVYLLVYFVFTVDFVWTAWRAIQAPSVDTILGVSMAAALIALALYARIFALTVQDRVIRLEMRLRLRELLPAVHHPRIGEFTKSQLVALRFAGDAELPAIAEAVLRDGIQDRKAIKQMVTNWQADHLRV